MLPVIDYEMRFHGDFERAYVSVLPLVSYGTELHISVYGCSDCGKRISLGIAQDVAHNLRQPALVEHPLSAQFWAKFLVVEYEDFWDETEGAHRDEVLPASLDSPNCGQDQAKPGHAWKSTS